MLKASKGGEEMIWLLGVGAKVGVLVGTPGVVTPGVWVARLPEGLRVRAIWVAADIVESGVLWLSLLGEGKGGVSGDGVAVSGEVAVGIKVGRTKTLRGTRVLVGVGEFSAVGVLIAVAVRTGA
jgi:hypothetical protein